MHKNVHDEKPKEICNLCKNLFYNIHIYTYTHTHVQRNLYKHIYTCTQRNLQINQRKQSFQNTSIQTFTIHLILLTQTLQYTTVNSMGWGINMRLIVKLKKFCKDISVLQFKDVVWRIKRHNFIATLSQFQPKGLQNFGRLTISPMATWRFRGD